MLNIAICDDMAILREIIEQHINNYKIDKGCSINIFHFESGEDLIDKFEEGKIKFDLFFLDFYMKELTGYETAIYIRQYDTTSHIVFVSSYSKYAYKFHEVKPLGIISKPVSKDDIYSILNKVLL